VPSLPGLWVASGCNGSGFSFSPAIGEALSDWITGGNPSARLAPFKPARFDQVSDDQLVQRGAWQYSHYYEPDA
jgi:4-methylaminobutanoate oxidase (formaldehyde-forming)